MAVLLVFTFFVTLLCLLKFIDICADSKVRPSFIGITAGFATAFFYFYSAYGHMLYYTSTN